MLLDTALHHFAIATLLIIGAFLFIGIPYLLVCRRCEATGHDPFLGIILTVCGGWLGFFIMLFITSGPQTSRSTPWPWSGILIVLMFFIAAAAPLSYFTAKKELAEKAWIKSELDKEAKKESDAKLERDIKRKIETANNTDEKRLQALVLRDEGMSLVKRYRIPEAREKFLQANKLHPGLIADTSDEALQKLAATFQQAADAKAKNRPRVNRTGE